MSRCFASVVLAVSLVGLVSAQESIPRQARTPTPLVTRLLPYVSDENFAKALELTPEQVKALVAFRQTQWDEQYTTPRDKYSEGTADRNKATVEVFQKTLSAEQHERAEELARQVLLNNSRNMFDGPSGRNPSTEKIDFTRIPLSTLRLYPEVATPLKLTEEQKKLVETQTAFFSPSSVPQLFLSSEQSKALKQLIGEPVAVNWIAARDERWEGVLNGPSGLVPATSSLFRLTRVKDVRAELALTDDQAKTLADLDAKASPMATRSDRTLSPKAEYKAAEALKAEVDKALAATLKPEQMARLKQIDMQVNRQFGGGRVSGWPDGGIGGAPTGLLPLSTRLNSSEVQKALTMTEAQVKSLTDAAKSLTDTIQKAALSDEPTEAKVKAIQAARATHEKACAAVLNAEQTKKLDELFGKPFTGNTRADRETGGVGSLPDSIKTVRAAQFGKRSGAELRLLSSNKAIQEDLGLKSEQVKALTAKMNEAETKYGPGFGGGPGRARDAAGMEKSYAEQSEFVEKALDGILSADQMKRLQQLMIQRAENLLAQTSFSRSISLGAIGLPGVAEAVKLTADQKKKLLDEGVNPDEVLTAGQKATIKELAGKKYDGDFVIVRAGPPFPTSFTAMPTTASMLLNLPFDVFKITAEQGDKLATVFNRYELAITPEPPANDGGPGAGFGRTRVAPEKLAAANDALAKSLSEILTAEQLARIEQVKYQALAGSGGNRYTHPEVVKALGITKEQEEKIAAVRADILRLGGELTATGFTGSNTGFGDQSWRTKYAEKNSARYEAILTDEQKAKWKKLVGDPVPKLPVNLTRPAFGTFNLGGGPGPGRG